MVVNIYRVEAGDGIGPYQLANYEGKSRFTREFRALSDKMCGHHCAGYHARLTEKWQPLFDAVPLDQQPDYIFGNTTEAHLRRWFGRFLEQLENLELGFTIVCYNVPRVHCVVHQGHAAFNKTYAQRLNGLP